ncbi:MAG: succinylglutamate desuccinylase/aspartoacylase family protein, partial [Xanthomonadales bacterium]|nr:succinylglutamate desuccinylase/aspartoacylase family protein [Xanthomonadales bacterium]
MARAAFEIGGIRLPPGQRRTIELPLSVMSNHVPVSLPVHVVHGRRQGPTLFLSAAIHGDEITGVEIIRRLLRSRALNRMAGTLLAVPIVNAFGFIGHSRYLPDRRDLNRVFPGSASGSLASQLAHLFMTEVVRR